MKLRGIWVLACLCLAAFLLMPACSGGGGGGGGDQDWLVGTWRTTNAPGPNSVVRVTYNANGSLSYTERDGDTGTGTWQHLSDSQIRITLSGRTFTVTVQRLSANQMRFTDSEGSSIWNRS